MRINSKKIGETSRDYAYRILKENIISLELKPGSVINDSEISLELGISRTPVREAIIELSKSGIVEIFPQKKSIISLIDVDIIAESRFFRSVIEVEVIGLACEMAVEKDIINLKENVQLQEFYINNKDTNKILELDNEFHRKIFSICKKDMIYQMGRSIAIHDDRLRNMSLSSIKEIKVVEEHKMLVKMIEEKNKLKAMELMKAHLDRWALDETIIRKKYPDYFK